MQLYAVMRRRGWRKPAEVEAAAERSRAEGERRGERLRWIRSYILGEQDGSLGSVCIYEAESPDDLREHAAAAELPADEVLPVARAVVVREDPAAASAG